MELNDIDLVTLAKAARGSAAFETLVRRHNPALRAFLLRMTSDAALADDLAQEAFLKAYRGIEGFRGGSSFRSWLFAIAMREAQMARRKDAARLRLANASPGEDVAAPAEFSIDLQRALLTLSDEERAAALLCDAAGFSHAEAANAMAAPLGTVKTLVARAREKLRAAMSVEEDGNGAENGAACA
ncbi:MAG TPA: RNA polymerase sigma factor [Parvularculaceae bacterium]|nr:RNA polymerase sigma factor [Parvularculaceae bacterium]HNS85313.1 RNA polymerase sigma factor [Parvularculaceae bacterium]